MGRAVKDSLLVGRCLGPVGFGGVGTLGWFYRCLRPPYMGMHAFPWVCIHFHGCACISMSACACVLGLCQPPLPPGLPVRGGCEELQP